MKKLINPTTYFFEQAQLTPTQNSPQIQQLVKKLLNKDTCELCKNPYDTSIRVPRILIHCGHSFCTPCLVQFFTNNRVRCPMCLKLVKKLNSVQRLPINHTIFTYIVEKQNKSLASNNIRIHDGPKFLYAEFQRVQKQAHRKQNPQKFDDQSGLPFCVFHSDRVQHFYCQSHKTFGCRVCIQIGHSKKDCNVVDLYTVDNPQKYQNIMEANIEETYPSGCFNPQTYQKVNHFGNVNSNTKNAIKNQISGNYFGFNNILDPALIDDSDQNQQEANKSF